jgi:hypothetical protein
MTNLGQEKFVWQLYMRTQKGGLNPALLKSNVRRFYMKHAKLILMALAALAISAFVYADNAYQVGYDQGYRNGLNDKQTRVEFNYENSYRTCQCNSNNSYTDSQFREGYKDGYVEGYSRNIYAVRNYNERPVYRNYEVRTDDRPVYRTYTATSYDNRAYGNAGNVIAFKKDDFRGDLVQFPMGRYPDLDKMNWEHKIESMQIPSNLRVILFDDENFKGQSLILETNAPDLGNLNFNKRAESMIIEPRY